MAAPVPQTITINFGGRPRGWSGTLQERVNPKIPTVTVKARVIAKFTGDATRFRMPRRDCMATGFALARRRVAFTGNARERNMGIILPVTLTAAAAAAIINLWLAIRVGQMRGATKTIHGDDAGGPLTRRMRAQLNFVENTPFVLVLIAAIELTGKGDPWLAWVAAIYMLGRVAHGFGMDGEGATKPRMIGTLVTMLTLLGLAVVAVLITLGVM